ncbi:MAG: heme exporter protein CcmD [Halioglobus sp.]|nr:heme exporter protein CcmD [Halioglobus sp.]
MYFDSLQAALEMQGHGMFVWPAYSVTIAVIALLVITPLLRRRKVLRQLEAQARRAQGAPAGRAGGER